MSDMGAVRLSKRLVPPLSGLDAALETIRRSASSQRGVGGRFERLMRRVLLEHPGEFRGRFTQVVPWGEWEERDGPDSGIDLNPAEEETDSWDHYHHPWSGVAAVTAARGASLRFHAPVLEVCVEKCV